MGFIEATRHEGVEGARFGKFNLADNSTAMVYGIDDILIDTGPPNQWKHVRKFVSSRPVTRVLLTHHHEDHSGNGARIARHFDVPIHVHENGMKQVENGFPLKLYQRIFWGSPGTFSADPMPDVIKTDGGHTLIPIHTPGHAPDHVCFLEPDKKWLFTGDLFLAPRPRLFRADEHLEGEIKSLKTILNHSFQTVFCAHKGIVPNGYDGVRKKLDYFFELVGKVKKLNAEGYTVGEITAMAVGKKDTIGLITFNHICSENLTRECLKVHDGLL